MGLLLSATHLDTENNSPQSAFYTDYTTKHENHVSCGYAIGLTSFTLLHQLRGHIKKHTALQNEQDYVVVRHVRVSRKRLVWGKSLFAGYL